MKNKQDKYILTFAIAFEILLLITAIVNFMNGVKRNGYVSIMSIFLVPMPFILSYLANKKYITLPSSFKATCLVFIFATQYLGELVGFYFTLWWWDLLLHAAAGFYAVVVGEALFIAMWAFCFSTTISSLWEIFEYIGDSLLKTNMLQEGLRDTFQDLLAGELLALLAAIVIYLKLRYRNSSSY